MGTLYVGLDVGSSTCHLVAEDSQGAIMYDREFPTSEANLIEAIRSIDGKVHVHLEASELAEWVRRVLKRDVAQVLVSHAKSNAWIAKDPLKGDRIDAYKLAELLRMGRVHDVYYTDDDHRTVFKRVVQHYDDVTAHEARLKQKIKARLRAQGVIVRGRTVYKAKGRKRFLDEVPWAGAREMIEQLFQLLDETLKTQLNAKRLMRRLSKRYPEIEHFKEVPGVGLISACRFSAYIQTPHRFSSKQKVWRYCRLGITDRTSDGKPLWRRALDRNGNGRLKDTSRTAFMGAMKCGELNAFKRAYRRSLQRTHDKTHARLTTQRKILTVLWAMWKGGTRYQDSKG